MDFGSKQCWLKPSKKQSGLQQPPQALQASNVPEQVPQFMNQNRYFGRIEDQQNNVDTNIVTIGFDKLKESEAHIQMGDPFFCKGCKAVLSKISKLEENKKKQDEDEAEEESKDNSSMKEEKEQNVEQVEEIGNMIWNCEFCQTKNVLNIEMEEVPQEEEVIYMVQSVNVSKINENNQSDKEEEQAIVFVIDVSGSMSVTAPIKNKDINNFKHSTMVSTEEFEMLKQFMDEEDIHQYTLMQSSQNFVSRKQCVLAAIQQQMEDLLNTNPNKKVGLIIFNNEVTIYGSGSADPIVITGDKLYRAEEIYNIASNCSKDIFNLPVKESKDRLIQIFDTIKEKDQTALGPALVAAIGVISKQKKGSQIIVCTDGLANVGVGSFEDQDKNNFIEFYEDLKMRAIEHDAIFNIISIKGEGCKLDILGGIADKTGGNVIRVDPDNLHKDFANILQDEVVALKAEMTIYLKNIMKFRNTDQEVDKVIENGSKCIKYIGNATKKTIATFEYTNKTDEEITQQKLQDQDDKITQLPFQAQISYYSLQGHKMIRVLTRNQEITFDKKVAEKNLNYNIINKRIATHTAQLIQNNNFSQARAFNKGWETYVQASEEVDEEKRVQFKHSNQMMKNNARKKQFTHKTTSELAQQPKSSIALNSSVPQHDSNDFLISQGMNFNSNQQQQPQQQQQFQMIGDANQHPLAMLQPASLNLPQELQFSFSSNQNELSSTAHFSQNIQLNDNSMLNNNNDQVNAPLQQNDLQIIKESQQQNNEENNNDDDDDVFSGDENYNEDAEEDEIETFMYQLKNNK